MRHDHDVAGEETLAGGMHESRTVVRACATVRRPVTKSSGAVRALLLHSKQVGFEGALRYPGSEREGREVLSYMDCEVPLPPGKEHPDDVQQPLSGGSTREGMTRMDTEAKQTAGMHGHSMVMQADTVQGLR
jgi:hypothetical protein